MDIAAVKSPEAQGICAVYAIGDIHGRLDLLQTMEELIQSDIRARNVKAPLICYLGDYIDRGPQSSQVIEWLTRAPQTPAKRVFLKGNHEDRMLEFLSDPAAAGASWLRFGGREALASYGVALPDEGPILWEAVRDDLVSALPPHHRQFLQDLKLVFRWRDFIFVHAGFDPERNMRDQNPHDLMWIREPFLEATREWGAIVVHGHVIVDHPDFRPNRVNIDTGAYKSGVLTCLVSEANSSRIIQARIEHALGVSQL